MSDETEFEFENESQGKADGPKALREAYDKKAAEVADLQKRVASFEALARKTTLADAFREKGVSEKLAKFYDKDDLSPEAVDAWLSENAEVFGLDLGADEADEKDKQAVSRMSQVNASGEAPAARVVASGNPQAGNTEELAELLSTLSWQELQERNLMSFDGKLPVGTNPYTR